MISTVLLGIFGRFKSWIIGAGAILLVIVGAFAKGFRDGKNSAIRKDRERLEKDVQRKRELDQDVANDSDSELDSRLRKWVKD
jgi:uncharacterized protein YpmB